jgi:4-amino-4-deoxychorismate lyase
MYPLVESILIKNKKIYNMPWHQARFDSSRRALFGHNVPAIKIKNCIELDKCTCHEMKCRIIYKESIESIEYLPYKRSQIQSAKLIFTEGLEYGHKFLERNALDTLYKNRGVCDEIIIINNGFVSDAYYYNLAFEKNDFLYTPQHHLLEGTKMKSLVSEGKLAVVALRADEIQDFDYVHFINALNPLGLQKISTKNIVT